MKTNTPDFYCKQKAAASGSSFYYSFLFLPPKKRQAIQALYAFCREVDDIVDGCADKVVAKTKLAWWYKEIERVFQGNPLHPIGRALAETLKEYKLKEHLFQEILQGVEMDLKYQGYQTFDDLKVYCHCVASCVGLLAAEIFGYQDQRTLEYARNLGIAMQLVNIIRDVGEDASLGRVYIPEDELRQFHLSADDILKKRESENFRALMQFQAERAKQYYQKALQVLPDCDRSTQISGLIMAEIYFALLKEIENTKFKVLHQRISLTPIRKFWIAWRSHRKNKKALSSKMKAVMQIS
jgi:phytoene synthase